MARVRLGRGVLGGSEHGNVSDSSSFAMATPVIRRLHQDDGSILRAGGAISMSGIATV
jgi:hypothetical protein